MGADIPISFFLYASIITCPFYKQLYFSVSLMFYFSGVRLPGLTPWLVPGPKFRLPQNGKIPYPHQATWSQPINMRPVRKREPIRGKLKSPGMPEFEKSPPKFGPIKLLCKHVTNLRKPATNCLCSPYKFV